MRLRALLPFLLAAMILASSQAFAVTLRSGDIIVVSNSPPGLVHIDAVTGEQTFVYQASVSHVAIDASGNLWVNTGREVVSVDPQSGQVVSRYSTNLSGYAAGIAFTSQTELLFVQDNALWSLDLSTGVSTVVSRGGGLFGLAITESGRVFSSTGGGVVEIDLATGAQTLVSGGFYAWGIAAHPSGQIYVTAVDSTGWNLFRIDPATGDQTLVSDFRTSYIVFALAIDTRGQLLVGVAGYNYTGSIALIGVNPNTGDQTVAFQSAYAPLSLAIVGSLPDEDEDGVPDRFDNCPDIPNPTQADADGNRVGDACNDAEDRDGDEWADDLDNCPDASNPDQRDLDGDLIGDVCDPFPTNPDNEFAQCTVDRDECQENLFACSDDLGQSLGDLAQAQQEIANLQTALAASEARIVQLEAELTACQGDLNQCLNPPPQCSDGIDNDGDGKIDFPADRQCRSADDLSELALPKPAR